MRTQEPDALQPECVVPRSFRGLFEGGAAQQELARVLDQLFGANRPDPTGSIETFDLLQHYGMDARWMASVRDKVGGVAGVSGSEERLQFPGGRSVLSIAAFCEGMLVRLPQVSRPFRCALVHGDICSEALQLGADGVVRMPEAVSRIRAHVLKDLAKLETTVLYRWTQINGESELKEAMLVSDWLLSVRDLGRGPDADATPEVSCPAIARAAATVLQLRSYYGSLLGDDREPLQLLAPQVRYAVDLLDSPDATHWQKRWALYTASCAAEKITLMLASLGPLRIDWMPQEYTGRGRLGITVVPGRRDYLRSLDQDIQTLRSKGIQAVLCLLADDEFERYGVPGLLDAYEAAGMDVLHLPTADRQPPDERALQRAVNWIGAHLETGGRVIVHCAAGLGRAGTVAGCWLRHRGLSGTAAIDMVRHCRSHKAIETPEQEHAVNVFQLRPTEAVAVATY